MDLVTLLEVKQYLKIEPEMTEDDTLLNSLILASEMYLYNATGKKFGKQNELAKLLSEIIISDWYENREMTYQSRFAENTHRIVTSMICQLKYCDEEVSGYERRKNARSNQGVPKKV